MIIDAHCHLGVSPQFFIPDASVAAMLRLMDRLGVERAIAAPMPSLLGQAELGWGEGLQAYRESGGRILLYAVFDPLSPTSLAFVRQSSEEPAAVGIKIHPSLAQCPADDVSDQDS